MFDISELKAKKLPELQELAKSLGVKRITGLKKLDLAYSIIDHMSRLPDNKDENKAPASVEKEAQPKSEQEDKQPHRQRTKQKFQNQNRKNDHANGDKEQGRSNGVDKKRQQTQQRHP